MDAKESNVIELLRPRYKVIADWPGVAGKVKAGDIIVSDGASNGYWVAGEPYQEDKLKDYPHLFKPLQWWEERKESEMPEYVRYATGQVRKVTKWDLETTSAWFMFLDNEPNPYCPGGSALVDTHWLPATKEEYDKANNLKQ